MKVYLAGSGWDDKIWIPDNFFNFYRLESFYVIGEKESKIINKYKGFLLDSGGFTFMNSKKTTNINWGEYIKKYGDFIIKYNVEHFFELDIDSIVGIKEVEGLRKKLEYHTGKKCIPVWHKSRGLEYWKQITKDYNYVAIGGIVTKEIKSSEYKIFTTLLKIAYENKCKVHGLGFTNFEGMKKYKFYSVDSTSWLSGNRFGAVYRFNGTGIKKHSKPKGMRVKTQKTAVNNFYEWVKFQKYAEQNL